MGGLGNGRRGGRPPPLMIGALIACILVLGFNYWVSSSRNLELQTKLYELEGQVRRGAAERGAAEMKKNEFQEEILRQKEQISHIESLYKRQLEGVQNTCSQEKGALQQNISSSSKTIQELKGQLNMLTDDQGKLQKDLQSCKGNINTLNKKLTYDMTHCHSQVLSQKELCDERVAAAKLEVQKKMEKLVPSVTDQGTTANAAVKEEGLMVNSSDPAKAATLVSKTHTPTPSQSKGNDLTELMTNEITVDNEEDAPANLQSPAGDLSEKDPVQSTTLVKQEGLPPPEGAVETEGARADGGKLLTKNLTEMEVMDVHEDGTQTEDPGMEGMLIGKGKADDALIDKKLDEPEDYDADEQVVGGDLEKQENKPADNLDKDMEDELADYNGDDENEGEFEADKQAELAQV